MWLQVLAEETLKTIGWTKYVELENGTLVRLIPKNGEGENGESKKEFCLKVIKNPERVSQDNLETLFWVRGCHDINIGDDPDRPRIVPGLFLIPY